MQEAVTHRELSFQKLLSKWATLGDVYRIYFPLNSWVRGKMQVLRCLLIIYKTKIIFFYFLNFKIFNSYMRSQT